MQEIHMLRALVDTDFRPFINGMQKMVNSTKDLRDAWVKAGRDIARAGERMTMAVAGMAATVATSFATFEQTITRAGAVTRTLGTKDFERLKEAAREMGRTTKFSATQAAEAIEQMGLAGLTTEEILAALPGALQLAAAAGVEIAQAADVAAKTMRAFGADAEELTHINDVLVGTFTRSNTDLGQLAEAMKQVAPVSKSLGVSLEQTASVIAKMSDAGFQGSMAGTALRNILMRLAGAVPEAVTKLNDLGVETQDANGKMRDLFDIIADIQAANISEADLLNIFGARGGPQFLALMETGIDSLRQFEEELTGLEGVSKQISDAMLNTLSGAFKIILSQIADLQIEAGEKLRPAFEQLAVSVTEFLDANKEEIIELMVDSIGLLTEGLTNLMVYLKENGKALIEFARSMGNVVASIANFLADSPQLLTFLATLKVAGLLGITQAINSLIPALFKLFQMFTGFGAAATTAQAGAITLKGAITGLFTSFSGLFAIIASGVAGGLALLDYFGALGTEAGSATEQIKQLNKALEQGEKLRNANLNSDLEKAAAADNPIEAMRGVVGQERDRFTQAFDARNRAQSRLDNLGAGQWFLTPAQRAEKASLEQQLKTFDAQLNGQLDRAKKAEGELFDLLITAFTDLIKEVESSDLPVEHAREMRDQFTKLAHDFNNGAITIEAFSDGFEQILQTANQKLEEVKQQAEDFARDNPEIAERDRANAVADQIAAMQHQNRIDNVDGFDAIRELVGDGQNLNAETLAQIAGTAKSVDSAHGDVINEQFVKDFQQLQEAGDLTAEAIDDVILTFLERLEQAREALKDEEKRDEELTNLIADAQMQARDRRTPGASRFTKFFDLANSVGASDDRVRDFLGAQEGADSETASRFAAQFNAARGNPQQFAEIAERFAAAINKAAEATQTAESATDQFKNSLDEMRGKLPTSWIQQAAHAFDSLKTKLLNGTISSDEFRRQLTRLQDGFSNAAQRASQVLQQLNQAAFNAMFGGGFRSGGIPRMAGLPSGVQNIGSPMDAFSEFLKPVVSAGEQFRDTVLETIEPVQAIFNAINPGDIPFVQTSGFQEAFDPAGPGGRNNGSTINISVQQLSDTEISRAMDRIEFERRRRGL